MHEILGKRSVIGQKKEALALLVEASDMEEMACVGGKKVKDGSLGMLVTARRGVAAWLIEEDRPWRKGMDHPTADANIIVRGDSRGEITGDGAVDGNTPLQDEFLTRAAGTKTRGR